MAADNISFTSGEHKARFVEIMQRIKKIFNGKFDPEYASALYVLTAHPATWQKAQGYVDRYGIDLPTMLEEVHFSSGYSVLITFAGNLFNNQLHVDPIELLRLDESNFKIALSALKIRRYGLCVSEVSSKQETNPDSLATAG
jgi:hypothetical protein